MPVQKLSATVWSDLGPLKVLSPPVIKYLVAQVADHVAHRSHTKSGLSVEAIAGELENESIEWSSKKIVRVCDALQTLLIAQQKSFAINPSTAGTLINDEITIRSAIAKPALVDALSTAINGKYDAET